MLYPNASKAEARGNRKPSRDEWDMGSSKFTKNTMYIPDSLFTRLILYPEPPSARGVLPRSKSGPSDQFPSHSIVVDRILRGPGKQ